MAKKTKILNIKGESYDVGYSSNDFSATDKSNLERLVEKNFPLKVTLTFTATNESNGVGSTAANALNGAGSNVPKEVKISWTLKYEGNSSNEDASQYEGALKVGSETINFGGAEMGEGNYTVSLSSTTTISLTVNGKVGSTTVYFAKPMYSNVLPVGETFSNLSALKQITPIATTISGMQNQTITGLTSGYTYWIAVPDNLTIKGAIDVNTMFGFPLTLDTSISITGYKIYKSSDLDANSNWTIKIS